MKKDFMEYVPQNGRKFIFLVILSLTVHLLILLCTLDIYFSTPLSLISSNYKVKGVKPPANRIVFILADGLSANAFYTRNMSTVTPYLHSIKEKESSWGISHVQPPTESRPQHIAVLAGFNEDPSSIFTKWKYNLYNFDSVLNLANKTFYFGGSSCFRYFYRQYYPNIIYVGFDYEKDYPINPRIPVYVERTVFNNARRFINNGLVSRSDKGQLIFVYVEGTDKMSHSLPHNSRHFRKNLKILDEEVQQLVKTVNSYFKDNKTTFIFTSDHGITVDEYFARSHGGGSRGETEVPFLAWGAGISVDKSERKDLKSIDVPPLISALIGITFPSNSLGSIPLNYLNISSRVASRMLIANALQLTEIFYAKQNSLKDNPAVLFAAGNAILTKSKILEWRRSIVDFIYTTKFTESIGVTLEYIHKVTIAIRSCESYSYWYRTVCVMVAVVGWIFNLLTWLPITDGTYTDQNIKKKRKSVYVYVMINIFLLGLYHVLGYKRDYALYIFLPTFTWFLVYIRGNFLKRLFKVILKYRLKDTIMVVGFFGFGTEMLILTFFNRKFLIPVIIGIICSLYNKTRRKTALAHVWVILGFFICVILYLPPPDANYNLQYQALYFILCFITITCVSKCTRCDSSNLSWLTFLIRYQRRFILMMVLTLISNFAMNFGFKWKWYEMVSVSQSISWFCLAYAIVFILRSPNTICYRFSSVIYAPMPIYVLLNGKTGPIAVLLFIAFSIIWIILELIARNQSEIVWNVPYDETIPVNMISQRDNARKVFIFISLSMLVFFGTLDMNSYKTLSYCENNFLIVMKIALPFIILTCGFLILVKASKIEMSFIFTLLLLFSTVMIIQVFFTVKTQGSWKDMTLSLVRFIIAATVAFDVLIVYFVSSIFAHTELGHVVRSIREYVNLLFNFYEVL